MKRLGIFFFYEKNGDVDDFITYYLRDLARNLTELIVVCNGKLSKQGRAAFEEFTDQIIVRENKGLDVWAYKTALDHYGWQRLSEFDEVVMTNSTLMGPVRPLKEMFDAMAERTNLDFWGLTIHHGAEGNPFKGKHLYNYLPVHIQSHFIVYRKKFIQSKELQNYWDTMPMIESYTDSVQRYESVFTKQFADKGYQWDVYVNTDDLKEFTDYPLLVCPTRLLRDKKCPLFKRRSFMHDFEAYLNDTAGEPVRELYAYLRDHTDYPLELIWKNMIRTMHPHEFTRNLGLTRIIQPTVQNKAQAEEIRANRRIALAMHLYFMDMLDQSMAFAAKFPPETDVFEAVRTANADGAPLACVLCDESQFFTAQQAEQLFMVTVDLNIPVICYGLRADFSLKGFPGSTRLLELAHTIEEMKTICTCGRKAICNCRRVNGRFVFEGEQVAIDLENDVQYVSMCPQCYFKAKRAFYAEKAASRVE